MADAAPRTYDDSTLHIADGVITIKKYYFPLGGSKEILVSDIRQVSTGPASFWLRWRVWGSSNLRNWLPLETRRPQKDVYVELDIGNRIRPTVTPDDPDRVLALLPPVD